jgi:hypothetical protein
MEITDVLLLYYVFNDNHSIGAIEYCVQCAV